MIADVSRYLLRARPGWQELERLLDLWTEARVELTVVQAQRFYFLYERACADLTRLRTWGGAETEDVRRLETLVGRAYGEILASHREQQTRWNPWQWLTTTLPQTIYGARRWLGLATLCLLLGAIFGAGAMALDPLAKPVLLPFDHLLGSPNERVDEEERENRGPGEEGGTFASYLMTHNIRVSLLVFALGLTAGVGTAIVLFYNGVILGAVVYDYLAAGEGWFLAGWLLPHGSVEIPAMLLAGAGGFLVGQAVLGRRDGRRLRERLASVRPIALTLVGGMALLLVWAGIIESFFSQFHAPVLPYEVKTAFGATQLLCLLFVIFGLGRVRSTSPTPPQMAPVASTTSPIVRSA